MTHRIRTGHFKDPGYKPIYKYDAYNPNYNGTDIQWRLLLTMTLIFSQLAMANIVLKAYKHYKNKLNIFKVYMPENVAYQTSQYASHAVYSTTTIDSIFPILQVIQFPISIDCNSRMNLLLCCGDIETNPGPVSQDS